MAKRVVHEEITCDGSKSCHARVVADVHHGRQTAQGAGWLIHPEIDLCPSCRTIPDFAHLAERVPA